jgi:hypothetical protein
MRPNLTKHNCLRRLGIDALEDRTTPTVSTIVSSFNGTTIPAGDTVWFNSVAKVGGLSFGTTTLHVTDGTVSFTSNGTPYTVDLPDMTITFTTLATSASTSYDASGWHITTPPVSSGNVFLGGAALPVPNGLPGGIKNVTWTGNFTSDTGGLTVKWQWAAAVYTRFGSSPGSFGVKTVDSGSLDAVYHNSDHAGTPEAFKQFVTGGARGGGGSNYTGSYSGTAAVSPGITQPVVDNTASLSGRVFLDNPYGQGVSGIEIDLQDASGQPILDLDGNAIVAFTDSNGAYSFNGLAAGHYILFENLNGNPDYFAADSFVGTITGGTGVPEPGHVQDFTTIVDIGLVGGNVGVDYDFVLAGGQPPG